MASYWNCLLLFLLIGFVRLGNVDAVESVTLTASIEFGRNDSICPVEIVEFNCTGVELGFLQWMKNGNEITSFSTGGNLNIPQTPSPGVTVVLNSFTDIDGLIANISSTLNVNTTSTLAPGDNITCGDRRFSDTTTTNYQFKAPPAVPGYIYSVNRGPPNSNTLDLTISLNETFLAENVIDRYCVFVVGGVCPPVFCLSPNETYTCNGLMPGGVYSIHLRAVNCETQYGEETDVLMLTPLVPPPLAVCESYPVYNQSNGVLIGIANVWDELENMTRLSVGMAQDPEYYIISYNVISSTTPTRVSIQPDDVCDDDGVCRYIVMDEFNRGTQYEVYLAVSNFVGSEGSTQCNNAIRSQNSIFSVTSTGPSTIDGNSTILCQFESVSENTTQECELCYSTRSDRCEPESDFICETITLTDGDVMAVFDEISFPYSSPEGPYGPFCYQVTVRIDNVTVAAVNGEAYTGCTPYALGTQITPEIDERCSSLNASINLEASITGENGVFCYEGTLQGSRAHLICDSGYISQGRTRAVCQREGSWGSVPICVEGSGDDILELWNIILIAVGGALWLINALLFVVGLVMLIKLIKSQFNGRKRVWHFLFIFLLLLTLILLLAAVGLWVAFGVITGLYQDSNDAEEREDFETLRDSLCIAAFVLSTVPLLSVATALLMYLLVPKCLSSKGSMAIPEKTEVTEFRKPEEGGGESDMYRPPNKSEDHLETIEMREPTSTVTEYRLPPETYPGQVPDQDGEVFPS